MLIFFIYFAVMQVKTTAPKRYCVKPSAVCPVDLALKASAL